MPSRKIEELLRNFRARFQPEDSPTIPMALRQESADIVFTALHEPSQSLMPTGVMGFEPGAGEMMPAGEDASLDSLMDELMGGMGAAEMPQDAMAGLPGGMMPPGAPQAVAGPPGA